MARKTSPTGARLTFAIDWPSSMSLGVERGLVVDGFSDVADFCVLGSGVSELDDYAD